MPMGAPGCPELACCTPSMDEGADGVDRKPLELVRGEGHRCLRVRGTRWRGCARRWGDGQRGGFGREAQSYRAGRRGPSPHSGPRSPRSRALRPAPGPQTLPAVREPAMPPPGTVARHVAPGTGRPAVVVLGDLVVDVVFAPDRDLKRGTDVTGRVHAAPGRLRGEHGTLAGPARRPEHAGLRDRARCRRARPGRRGHRRRRHGARGARRRSEDGPHRRARGTGRRAFVRHGAGRRPSAAPRGPQGLAGSRAPTPCTCPPTRCSTSPSARPGWPPRSSPTRPASS